MHLPIKTILVLLALLGAGTAALAADLPMSWPVFDEIYEFKNHDAAKVHRLLTLDKHPQRKTPGDFPVSWCKPFGQGRVFYTSLGHREDVWDVAATGNSARKNAPSAAARYQLHILGGLRWALGLAPGDATPAN